VFQLQSTRNVAYASTGNCTKETLSFFCIGLLKVDISTYKMDSISVLYVSDRFKRAKVIIRIRIFSLIFRQFFSQFLHLHRTPILVGITWSDMVTLHELTCFNHSGQKVLHLRAMHYNIPIILNV
jgi:hypothetical protein